MSEARNSATEACYQGCYWATREGACIRIGEDHPIAGIYAPGNCDKCQDVCPSCLSPVEPASTCALCLKCERGLLLDTEREECCDLDAARDNDDE